MASQIPVELGPVQETLLIPLLGRASETRKPRGMLRDDKAVTIVESLDYDFGKWQGAPSLSGAVLRTRIYDDLVGAFLAEHPEGTVVEIGAGLNTRYERLDNGRAHWLELDLPDSMALRRQFFEDTARRTMIAASVLETDWHQRVRELPAPYLFVSEAVIIYLDNAEVEGCLRDLAQAFPGAQLITDTTSSKMVDNQHKHDAMKELSRASWFRWRCDDPAQLERLGLTLERSITFADSPPDVVAAMPLAYRLMLRLAPFVVRRMVRDYRINRFRFG